MSVPIGAVGVDPVIFANFDDLKKGRKEGDEKKKGRREGR
jgi:hypothetical protein